MDSHDDGLAPEEPLLFSSEKDWDTTPRRKSSYWTKTSFLVHAVVATTYFILISVTVPLFLRRHDSPVQEVDFYSPARQALDFSLQEMRMDPNTFAIDNPFVGEPRPELDHAWDELLQNIQITVSSREFAQLQPQLNRSTLRLPDGSHIIRLRVYHELHCLKWIRKWMHRDHYWPDLAGEELRERRWHIEHCLEGFRRDAMCKPNLAPGTFYFLDSTKSDAITADGSHLDKCANWDKLDAWAGERRVDLTTLDRASLRFDDE